MKFMTVLSAGVYDVLSSGSISFGGNEYHLMAGQMFTVLVGGYVTGDYAVLRSIGLRPQVQPRRSLLLLLCPC